MHMLRECQTLFKSSGTLCPTDSMLIVLSALCLCQHLAFSHIYFNTGVLQIGACVSMETWGNKTINIEIVWGTWYL